MQVQLTLAEAKEMLSYCFPAGAEIVIQDAKEYDPFSDNVSPTAENIVQLLVNLQNNEKLEFMKQLRFMYGMSLINCKRVADHAWECRDLARMVN